MKKTIYKHLEKITNHMNKKINIGPNIRKLKTKTFSQNKKGKIDVNRNIYMSKLRKQDKN
jgi:hypothetical protein